MQKNRTSLLHGILLKKLFLCFILLFVVFHFHRSLNAQFLQSSFVVRDTVPEPKQLNLSIRSVSFFHNNEFFHPLVKGYTLTGTWLQPEFIYSFSKDFSGSFGVHLLKYHGMEGLSRKLPVFSFTYSPAPFFSLTLGNFPGGEYHRLTEVLFNPERHLSSYPEGGLSARLSTQAVETEIWLDWERMILHGAPFNEEITAGLSSVIKLPESANEWRMNIPIQILGKHEGGQINTGDRSVNTWWNMLTGIEASRKYDKKHFRELMFILHFPFYYHEGETGFGIFPRVEGNIFGNKISAGYFKAVGFKTIHGLGLYNSYEYDPFLQSNGPGGDTELIMFKSGYTRTIGDQFNLILRFDAWYDIKRSKIDYMSGIYFAVWFDKKMNFRRVNQ